MNLCILYLANRKHIRILSLEILEIEFDVAHLTVNIPIGNNGLGATDEPLFVVHAIKQNGNLSFLGDVIESFLPFGVQRTRSLGGDAQHEVLSLTCGLGKTVRHARLLGTEHGDASQLTEYGAKQKKKPFFLERL